MIPKITFSDKIYQRNKADLRPIRSRLISTSNKYRNFWAGEHSELLQPVEKLAELHPLALNYKILITAEIF